MPSFGGPPARISLAGIIALKIAHLGTFSHKVIDVLLIVDVVLAMQTERIRDFINLYKTRS